MITIADYQTYACRAGCGYEELAAKTPSWNTCPKCRTQKRGGVMRLKPKPVPAPAPKRVVQRATKKAAKKPAKKRTVKATTKKKR